MLEDRDKELLLLPIHVPAALMENKMIKVILDKKLKCFLKKVWNDIVEVVAVGLLFTLACVIGAALYVGVAYLIYNMTEKHIDEAAIPLAMFGPALLASIAWTIYEYIEKTWSECR